MGKYTLKEGVVIKPYGVNSLLTNEFLNDGIAEMLIKKGKAKKEDFIIKQDKKQIRKNGNNK
jgi:hypothetical protein